VSLLNSLEEYATDVAKMNETGLSRVSELVRKQIALEKRVEDIEEELKAAKENLRQIAEQDLPNALHEMGMKEVKMEDGSIVSVSNFYNVSIPKDKTEEAFDWLRLNGHGDLVKNVVSATFGRAEDNRAKDLIGKLSDEGYAR
jgi:outer membrane murein-binding lipoprotein Lpp